MQCFWQVSVVVVLVGPKRYSKACTLPYRIGDGGLMCRESQIEVGQNRPRIQVRADWKQD